MVKVDFDQHYMIDEELLDLLVEQLHFKKEDSIIEIGPGKGALTKRIIKHKNYENNLTVLEIDEKHIENLKKLLPENKIIIGNALENVDKVKCNKIISNLPYSLCEPLSKKLIRMDFEKAIFTTGMNFYKILKDNTRKLHYEMSSKFKIKLIKEVSKESFDPEPKVESCAFSLERRIKKTVFDDIIIDLFKQHDKTLKNALVKSIWDNLDITKKESKEIVAQLNLSEKELSLRADLQSNQSYVRMIQELKRLI